MEDETKEQENWFLPALLMVVKVLGVLAALYFFLFGLDLMGGSFAALGGKGAAQLFTFTDNPISGLMVGVLATVLVQSSSTSTSIVVGLVGAEVVSVKQAIPIVMGANIGTSVTNTIVSMGHVGDRSELERAFSGATVHDMFNMFSVLVLLPLEVAIGAVTGGGLLFWISKSLTEAISGSANSQLTFKSPIKIIVSDLTKIFLKKDKDKDVIKALSFGAPAADVTSNGTYYCVSEKVCKVWRKVAKRSCEALTPCAFASTCPSRCYTDAGSFYAEEIERARTIKGGFLKGAGDVAGGMIGLALSLVILCIALGAMVRLLHSLVMGQAKRATVKGASMNNYVAMLIGVGLTIIVQSSSVVTSTLTPLVGIGVLSVQKMLPMTLGANIGTTFTSMLAALAIMKPDAIQIAFCHLFFNILGILIWYPFPPMRRPIIAAACTLGFYASYWRLLPLLYILVMFLAVPGLALVISLLYTVSVAGGVAATMFVLAALASFEYWWFKKGCYKEPDELEEPEAPSGSTGFFRTFRTMGIALGLLSICGLLGILGIVSLPRSVAFTKPISKSVKMGRSHGLMSLRELEECFQHGVFYGSPTHMPGTSQVLAASAPGCQENCENTAHCTHFSFWPDGNCLLTDDPSTLQSSPQDVISGPVFCPGHPGETDQDYDTFGPRAPYEDYDPYNYPDNDDMSRRLRGHMADIQRSSLP